jgi:D-alanine--poly(phosphoribitol) ligase subunit 2
MNILEQIVYPVIDDIGSTLDNGELLEKSPDTKLYGEGGILDSLGLVSLVVALEEKILDEVGRTITIADSRAMSQQHSPFRTIGSIANYINELLGDAI